MLKELVGSIFPRRKKVIRCGRKVKAKPLWSGWMINQKIDYIHANPVKAKLVKSARDYYWSSFCSFYCQGDEPLAVDHDWWWPDDSEKLSKAMKELGWHSYWKRGEEKWLV